MQTQESAVPSARAGVPGHPHRARASPPAALPAADATLPLRPPDETGLLTGPTREDIIRRRAYERYEHSGCVDGHALDDWLAAEAEVGALTMAGDTGTG